MYSSVENFKRYINLLTRTNKRILVDEKPANRTAEAKKGTVNGLQDIKLELNNEHSRLRQDFVKAMVDKAFEFQQKGKEKNKDRLLMRVDCETSYGWIEGKEINLMNKKYKTKADLEAVLSNFDAFWKKKVAGDTNEAMEMDLRNQAKYPNFAMYGLRVHYDLLFDLVRK